MQPSVEKALREARQRLQEMYGDRLVHVILYGSQARGDARPDSDVDVLVVLEGPVDFFAEIEHLVALEHDLLNAFSVSFAFQPYEKHKFDDLERPLMFNARAEGIEV